MSHWPDRRIYRVVGLAGPMFRPVCEAARMRPTNSTEMCCDAAGRVDLHVKYSENRHVDDRVADGAPFGCGCANGRYCLDAHANCLINKPWQPQGSCGALYAAKAADASCGRPTYEMARTKGSTIVCDGYRPQRLNLLASMPVSNTAIKRNPAPPIQAMGNE